MSIKCYFSTIVTEYPFEIPSRKRLALGVFAGSNLLGFDFAQDDTLKVCVVVFVCFIGVYLLFF